MKLMLEVHYIPRTSFAQNILLCLTLMKTRVKILRGSPKVSGTGGTAGRHGCPPPSESGELSSVSDDCRAGGYGRLENLCKSLKS